MTTKRIEQVEQCDQPAHLEITYTRKITPIPMPICIARVPRRTRRARYTTYVTTRMSTASVTINRWTDGQTGGRDLRASLTNSETSFAIDSLARARTSCTARWTPAADSMKGGRDGRAESLLRTASGSSSARNDLRLARSEWAHRALARIHPRGRANLGSASRSSRSPGWIHHQRIVPQSGATCSSRGGSPFRHNIFYDIAILGVRILAEPALSVGVPRVCMRMNAIADRRQRERARHPQAAMYRSRHSRHSPDRHPRLRV